MTSLSQFPYCLPCEPRQVGNRTSLGALILLLVPHRPCCRKGSHPLPLVCGTCPLCQQCLPYLHEAKAALTKKSSTYLPRPEVRWDEHQMGECPLPTPCKKSVGTEGG